jgi:hypothetical protein
MIIVGIPGGVPWEHQWIAHPPKEGCLGGRCDSDQAVEYVDWNQMCCEPSRSEPEQWCWSEKGTEKNSEFFFKNTIEKWCFAFAFQPFLPFRMKTSLSIFSRNVVRVDDWMGVKCRALPRVKKNI